MEFVPPPDDVSGGAPADGRWARWRRGYLRRAPDLIAAIAAVLGVLTLVDAFLPRERWRVHVITRVIPNVARKTLEAHILKHVKREAKVSTDELYSYKRLWMYGYDHESVNHAAKEYARGDRHTNTIEGFWSMIKRSIRGTHVHVSSPRLPLYLGEFEFRWNLRRHPEKMFPALLSRLSTSLPEGF